MRVVCIDGKLHGDELLFGMTPVILPVEGNIYDAFSHTSYDDSYLIPELHPRDGYRKFRFIPLSDIDET